MRILVAMSGGVDSSVAAALLKEQGHEVLGVTLKVWQDSTLGQACARPGGDAAAGVANPCCGAEAMADAAAVAARLGIAHYVLNYEELFRREVVQDYLDSYRQGRTPNPCIVCNDRVKFGSLLKTALDLGAEALATGHYARVERGADGACALKKACDPRKDQTYFLYRLGQAQLRRLIFPLGELDKPAVRQQARRWGLRTADKPESMELCFAPAGDHGAALRALLPKEALQPGPITDAQGKRLGQHQGLAFYTIGQRKGLGLPGPEPCYVSALDPASNTVVVSSLAGVRRQGLLARDARWIADAPPVAAFRATVKIRSAHPGAPALVTPMGPDSFAARFDAAQPAITPGQAAVVYDAERCLGGGVIFSPQD
jgi:tRNA-specific 2-thiouridylase